MYILWTPSELAWFLSNLTTISSKGQEHHKKRLFGVSQMWLVHKEHYSTAVGIHRQDGWPKSYLCAFLRHETDLDYPRFVSLLVIDYDIKKIAQPQSRRLSKNSNNSIISLYYMIQGQTPLTRSSHDRNTMRLFMIPQSQQRKRKRRRKRREHTIVPPWYVYLQYWLSEIAV